MKILLDNGHGFDIPGKRSPDGHIREYASNRYLAFLIREGLSALGLDCQLIVPEREAVAFLESEEGSRAIVKLHVDGNLQIIKRGPSILSDWRGPFYAEQFEFTSSDSSSP